VIRLDIRVVSEYHLSAGDVSVCGLCVWCVAVSRADISDGVAAGQCSQPVWDAQGRGRSSTCQL